MKLRGWPYGCHDDEVVCHFLENTGTEYRRHWLMGMHNRKRRTGAGGHGGNLQALIVKCTDYHFCFDRGSVKKSWEMG